MLTNFILVLKKLHLFGLQILKYEEIFSIDNCVFINYQLNSCAEASKINFKSDLRKTSKNKFFRNRFIHCRASG